MELMGRFWRAPFQRQQPYVLGNRMRFMCTLMENQSSRVSHENVDAVFGIFLVLALRLEHKFLQNVIVTSNHTK